MIIAGNTALAAVEHAVEVRRQNATPRIRRHGGEQSIFVAAGVVDQHVEALVPRQNFFDRRLPGFGRGDIQRDAETTFGIFPRQWVGMFAVGADAEPDDIGGRLLEKSAGDRLAQTAVRTGNQNNPQAHGRMLPVGAAADK